MPNDDDEKHRAHAARAAAELKETEDLLAGFDRPGRTPRTPPVRDFVDFHLKKDRSDPNARASGSGRASPAGAGTPGAASPNASPFADLKRADPTFVITRKMTLPKWLPWAALLLAMPVAGSLVAYCTLTGEDPSKHSVASSPLPSAATTISAASAPATGAERDIPLPTATPPASDMAADLHAAPPPQPDPSVTANAPVSPPSPPPNAPSTPPASTSAKTSPSPSGSNDPRVDFIRNL